MANTTRKTTSKSGRNGGALPAAKPVIGGTDVESRTWMATTTGLRIADSETSQAGFLPGFFAPRESSDRHHLDSSRLSSEQTLVRT